MLSSHSTGATWAWVLLLSLALLVFKFRSSGHREKDIPPGPRTTLFLGNARDFPTSFPHIKFTQWSSTYGDIYSLKVFSQTVIVLSSASAIKEVLDINSTSTSNRPPSALVQLVTGGVLLAFENMTSPVWKHGRKAISTILLSKARLARHQKAQSLERLHFLHDILSEPTHIYKHIRRMTLSGLTTLVYGLRITGQKGSLDPETYFRAVKFLNMSLDPGAHPPVDVLWPLQYVPKRWAAWKRFAERARWVRDYFYESLHIQCEGELEIQGQNDKQNQGRGLEEQQNECFVHTLLTPQSQSTHNLALTRPSIIGLSTMIFDAGVETTASYMQSFTLALLNHPQVQIKAQAEIDHIIGVDRMPELDDFDNLPYVRALVDEVFRFRTVLPISLPHMSTRDVWYKGYRIPGNSTIFMNIHALYHDPDLFHEPETFDPERFLKSEFGTKVGTEAATEQESASTSGFRKNYPFGAGRRICPGEILARRTIALSVMNLLWGFMFTKDASGTGGYDMDAYAKARYFQNPHLVYVDCSGKHPH